MSSSKPSPTSTDPEIDQEWEENKIELKEAIPEPNSGASSPKAAAAAAAAAATVSTSATDHQVQEESKAEVKVNVEAALREAISPFNSKYPESANPASWIPATKDGHVLMYYIKKNDNTSEAVVPPLNRVYALVEGRLSTGEKFVDSLQEEFDWTLGQAQVPRGLEMVVCQLRVGDHVLLRCASDYNYSPTRRPANVREDDTLFMEVQIIRHEKEKNLHEMTLIDRIQYAKRRRETGNSLFTSGQYRSAQKHYEKALSVLNGLDAPQEQLPEKDKQLVRIHNALNQLNLAMSLIKYGAHDKAIEQCNKVLLAFPQSVKALWRRVECRRSREEYSEALSDLNKLKEIIDLRRKKNDETASASPATSPTNKSVSANPDLQALFEEADKEMKKMDSIGMPDDKFLALIDSSVTAVQKLQEKLNQRQKSKLSGFLLNNDKVQKALLYDEKEAEEAARLKADTEGLMSFDVVNTKKDLKTKVISAWDSITNMFRGWCRRCKKDKETKEE